MTALALLLAALVILPKGRPKSSLRLSQLLHELDTARATLGGRLRGLSEVAGPELEKWRRIEEAARVAAHPYADSIRRSGGHISLSERDAGLVVVGYHLARVRTALRELTLRFGP